MRVDIIPLTSALDVDVSGCCLVNVDAGCVEVVTADEGIGAAAGEADEAEGRNDAGGGFDPLMRAFSASTDSTPALMTF